MVLFTSCSRRASSNASAQDEKVFSVRGLVRSVSDDTITVEHEEITGLMPAMTMPFEPKNRSDIAGIHAGEAVQFQLHTAGLTWWISNVEKISVNQLKPVARESSTEAPSTTTTVRLKEGDTLPDFALTDQKKQPLSRETFKDKTLLLTFIFTRCPMPNYCPQVTSQFSKIQTSVLANSALARRVRLLSITLDPTYDTSEVLANYGAYFNADAEVWRFGGGRPEDIKQLTSAFSVYAQPEGGTISHGLCTALVGPDGVIRKIWRGNAWTADDVLREMRSL